MNSIPLIESARNLKTYINTHPHPICDAGCETVLELLYQAYADSQEHDPPEIEQDFEQLGNLLEVLPLELNNTIFSHLYRLCSAYEQKAYCDGLQIGAHLIQELLTKEIADGHQHA